jgi:hypothetical protein
MIDRAARHRAGGVLAVITGMVLIAAGPAGATHIGCGAVLGPGGSFTLDSDVGPCPGPEPALTVDSARLNLDGFEVSCASTSTEGILVLGTRALVRNGTVNDCSTGVHVAGEGRHRVRNMGALGNDVGFLVESDHNQVVEGAAFFSEVGIVVGGSENLLDRSLGVFSNGTGIDVSGNDNVVKNVQGSANIAGAGLRVTGDRTRVRGGRFEANGTYGVEIVVGATDNGVRGVTALDNNADIDLFDGNPDCDDDVWKKNTFTTASPDCIE